MTGGVDKLIAQARDEDLHELRIGRMSDALGAIPLARYDDVTKLAEIAWSEVLDERDALADALVAAEAREKQLREAALWVRADSQQEGRGDPFGSQGPAITVGGNAYEALVAALGHISQEKARRVLAAGGENPEASDAR